MRWTRRIGTALAALFVTVALVWGVGAMLPVEHRASVSASLPAAPDTVWSRIDRIDRWPEWRDAEVRELTDESAVVTEGGETLRYRIERPAERTLVTTIDTPDLPFGGRWIWTVTPSADGGSTVTIVEEGEVYAPIFRFVSRFVIGHDATLRAVMAQLEASFSEPD